jgi:malate synthase
VPGGTITRGGVHGNVSTALQYLNAWLGGIGAAAINNLMEDAATAEISRAQLWQWIRFEATLADGSPVTPKLYRSVRDQELTALGGKSAEHYGRASELLDELVLNDQFIDFLTLPEYDMLAMDR